MSEEKNKKRIIPNIQLLVEEKDMNRYYDNLYEEIQKTPENMSNWLWKIKDSVDKSKSNLNIPRTVIANINKEWWKWLRSDNYTDEKVKEFNEYLWNLLKMEGVGSKDILDEDIDLFIKTGIFSDKFTFSNCHLSKDYRNNLGNKYKEIYYSSSILGADKTREVVLREYIHNKDGLDTIYKGMPLRIEFRYFYDFDTKKIVGSSLYWHEEYMKRGLYNALDLKAYALNKDRLRSEYEENKLDIKDELEEGLKYTEGLSGKWSVDVMKEGNDYYIIDLARMERSALVDVMEEM